MDYCIAGIAFWVHFCVTFTTFLDISRPFPDICKSIKIIGDVWVKLLTSLVVDRNILFKVFKQIDILFATFPKSSTRKGIKERKV